MFFLNDFDIKIRQIMAQNINHLNLQYINDRSDNQINFYTDERFYISITVNSFASENIKVRQPYRLDDGRVLLITGGEALININLKNYTLKKNMGIVSLPNTIIEILERSDDFDFMVFSFPTDLPIVVKIDSELVFDLNDGQSSLIREYFNLMWREVHQPEVMSAVIEHLQLAMLMKLYHINEMQQILRDVTETREYVTLNRFIRLVIEHSTLHRNIPFYADILCLTPNHLGAVIKQASGLTARQWINRFVIQEAKVQLKYSNHSILEISEQLNFPNPSFFSRFFKRLTGMTPNEYRHL